MAYFSRLTDIVTCSLTQILAESDDPPKTIAVVIREMQEGLAGAKRSVSTAMANEERLQRELNEHQEQIDFWTAKAKEALEDEQEDEARQALRRKREVQDLVAGLQQQYQAAVATREHLTTTLRALEARLAEARRKQQEVASGAGKTAEKPTGSSGGSSGTAMEEERPDDQIEAELEALKRELGKG